jgi:hypothetical protein
VPIFVVCTQVDSEYCNYPEDPISEDLKTLEEGKSFMLLFLITLNAHYCFGQITAPSGINLLLFTLTLFQIYEYGNLFRSQMLVLHS